MITTILFDWDGTIQQTIPIWVSAYQEILKNKYGITISKLDVIQHAFLGGLNRPEVTQITNIPAFWSQLIEFAKPKITKLPFYPEIIETLDRLDNYQKAIVTGSDGPTVEETIRVHGLKKYFRFVLGKEDVYRGKPDSEMICKAIKTLHSKPEETVVVGDLPKDILAGKNAGTKTILFLPEINRQFYDFDELRKSKPDFEISSWSEFPDSTFNIGC